MKKTTAIFTCIGYNEKGLGIIDYKGKQMSVANLMQGERAELVITKKGGYYQAKLLRLLRPSDARVTPPCPYYENCGGCQLQHMSGSAQRALKQKMVSKALKSFGKVQPIVMMKQPHGYRNKSHHSFGYSKRGHIVAGLYRAFSHKLVAIERCLIHDARADRIANTVVSLMEQLHIAPYQEDLARGHIRHMLTRVAQGTDQILVTLVTAQSNFPHKQQFIETLRQRHPEINTLVQNINTAKTSMVLGEREEVLYGAGYIIDQLLDHKFVISSQSFYQVNRRQSEQLYKKALSLARIAPHDVVLDAYCGIGTLSLLAAAQAKQVIGVEINQSAVADANQNAKLNDIDNATFIAADAAAYLKESNQPFDCVMLDPPRQGASKALIDNLIKHTPKKIVFISCNPTTQARDIRQLSKAGYRVKTIAPYDMFPYTGHIECVVGIQKIQ